MLDGLARPLLGNLLRNTLLVHAPVDYGPGDLTGVLPLQEERLSLGGGESEDLQVCAVNMILYFDYARMVVPCCLHERKGGPC